MSTEKFESDLITQIIYLEGLSGNRIEDKHTDAGIRWSNALDLIIAFPGLARLYWGRRLEDPEKVQLHLVWEQEQRSRVFLSSDTYKNEFFPVAKWLTGGKAPQVRHTTLQHQALEDPFGSSLLGYPIGTAIYTGADVAWQYAWPLWTHIVRHVDGCKGIAGGKVREPVDGLENGYVVYVGWQTVKHHDDYHHTEHFQKHWVVLQTGVQGWVEYGHVVFVEIRDGISQKSQL